MRNCLVVLFVCLLVVAACEKKGPEITFPEITYEMRTLETTTGIDADTAKSFAEIQIAYPEVTDADRDTVKTLLNQFIYCFILDQFNDSMCQTTIESQMDGFIREYKDFKSYLPDVSQHWESRTTVAVLTDTLGVFSIGLSMFTYTGGAHPNSATYFANFSAFNGDYIRLDDVFKEGYREELAKIGEYNFRLNKNIGMEDSLSSAGYWFKDDTFRLNDNYLFGKENLVFYYNQYEIAPYATGATELKIPYQLIGNMVKPESVLGVYLNGLYKK